MIRPTLFVGLGTTGTNILKYLRRLIFEEYERAGLPIFRYVSVETDKSESGEDPGLRLTNHMTDYERLTVARATIADTTAIEHKITLGDPLYNENLAEWLDPELLRIGERSFEAGAKNVRMAGRLCLWENFAQVEQTLTTEYGAIIAPANMTAAGAFLKKHYARKGVTPDGQLIDPSAIDIYLVGSLCGGTCSGTLIDVAYFFHSIFASGNGGDGGGAAANSKIYGIFTMYDSEQATDVNNSVRAANCYGSLWELNFYNHKDITYSITFPSGRSVESIKDPPFDYMMFVSRSGRNSNVKFNKPDGSFDEEGLNQMVALNLFADVAGDSSGQKNAIRTNWYGHTGYRQLKPVIEGQTPKMVRGMASFGLTAVWYPKYRIATASACLIGKRLCESWLKSYRDEYPTRQAASQTWQSLLEGNVDRLTSPEGGRSLKSQINELLTQARKQFEKATSAEELERMMRGFPRGGSFLRKFDQEGEYYNLIEMQVPGCQEALHDALFACVRNQVSRIDFDGNYGIADVKSFLQTMDDEIAQSIEDCPARLPTLNLGELDFGPMRRAEQNRWLKAVGLQQKSVQQHRSQLIEDYCQLINGDKTDIYVKLRNYFLRPILQKLRSELGIGVQPDDSSATEEHRTIQRMVSLIEANLNKCVRQFEKNHREAVEPPKQINVEIVANNPGNRIDVDVERLSGRIAPADATSELPNEKKMFDLNQGHEEILVQMKEVYRRLSLSKIGEFHVVTKAQQIIAAGTGNPVAALARRSNPYQTFNGLYQPLPIPTQPTLIYGQDPTGHSLQDLQTALSGQGISFAQINPSTVDHLVFFYCEEAGFALDDLEAFQMLRLRFNASPGPYGHLTHQNPTFYDIEFSMRRQQLQRWMEALRVLVPLIRQQNGNAFEGVFHQDSNGDLRYRYQMDQGLEDEVYLDEDSEGITRLAQSENKTAYDRFVYQVQLNFRCIGRKPVTQLINELLAKASREERPQQRDLYKSFLDEVYSDDGMTLPPSPSHIDRGQPKAQEREERPESRTDTFEHDTPSASDTASTGVEASEETTVPPGEAPQEQPTTDHVTREQSEGMETSLSTELVTDSVEDEVPFPSDFFTAPDSTSETETTEDASDFSTAEATSADDTPKKDESFDRLTQPSENETTGTNGVETPAEGEQFDWLDQPEDGVLSESTTHLDEEASQSSSQAEPSEALDNEEEASDTESTQLSTDSKKPVPSSFDLEQVFRQGSRREEE